MKIKEIIRLSQIYEYHEDIFDGFKKLSIEQAIALIKKKNDHRTII